MTNESRIKGELAATWYLSYVNALKILSTFQRNSRKHIVEGVILCAIGALIICVASFAGLMPLSVGLFFILDQKRRKKRIEHVKEIIADIRKAKP